MIENKLSDDPEINKHGCIHKMIDPVFHFNQDHQQWSKLMYTITILLWSVSIFKMYCKYTNNTITKWQDLFTI
jgi:hypothetical protein